MWGGGTTTHYKKKIDDAIISNAASGDASPNSLEGTIRGSGEEVKEIIKNICNYASLE
ncbi:hypothetical protein Cni_G18685 [Canna indica]|uniref:Uncharacterized protein n=1 Tax=Canna indica TaxID=4628 RepID=A0AAQ3QHT5_9LILI|nr:hypothetical protein Cni_G18685 [Canna indica]